MKIRFLAPSRAHRWTVCHGSVRAERLAPIIPGDEKNIANEGSAAHKLFEICLTKKTDAEAFIGEEIELPKGEGTWKPNEDMVLHVQDGVDLVQSKVGTGTLWTEHYVDLKIGNVQCGGTLDAGWYGLYKKDPFDPKSKSEWQLHVLDLKYGYGAVAGPRQNKQIRIYALGKLKQLLRQGKKVDTVHLWIYQPRLDHIDGPFMHDVVTVKELAAFEKELKVAIKATENPKAGRVAGPHCLYCAAHAVCVTAERAIFNIARQPPSAEDSARMGVLLNNMPIIKQWMNAVNTLAYHMAQEGMPPDGWMLGAGRRTRVWNGEKEELPQTFGPRLQRLFGLKPDEYAPRKMLGVARVRAIIAKTKIGTFDDFWHWSPGKEKLQPVDNARMLPRLESYFDDEDEIEAEKEFLG